MTAPMVRVFSGLDMKPLQQQLADNHQLWNEQVGRTYESSSPHNRVDDIWVRYGVIDEAYSNKQPHESVFYPAYDVLTAIPDLVFGLMHRVRATRLGGILITRVRPGQRVEPHIDKGWHAGYYQKWLVQVAGGEGQAFHFDDFSMVTETGDVCLFRNDVTHWVTNDSDHDRISMVVCLRTD